MKTNEKNCILRHNCKLAGTTSCTKICPFYISLHGYSGNGGRLAEASIPKDYQLLTIEHNPIRKEQPNAYKDIDDYSNTFSRIFEEDGERIRSLYLFSEESGTGKTTAACSILNSFLIYYYIEGRKRNIQIPERIVYYLDFNKFQLASNESNHPLSTPEEKQRAKSYLIKARLTAIQVPLLVIDDIGMRKPTEAFGSLVHELINHRVTNRLPIIFTSNIPMEELLNCYDKRLYDRIRDQNIDIYFEGDSKRGIRKDYK